MHTPTEAPAADLRRCWDCRTLWPRTAMRWGFVHAPDQPLWYARAVRVLRCPTCLTDLL